ncbi:hypothetical protein HYH02_006950 [Chlamydomonas schloesseri]|uniref:Uncharacterized protein n=1 Tax=Chlamydomonas schloesseri TaxID=2026947 RepID=A0A835WJC9_9CHLO|nr:hypothetical protein HYH02_006950 [Chlamydomonas schloesseri]|eukprot:KAG2448368.1 hypothetical protein HYH02_006950 [Chlamydomonas schloesseri]
MPPRGDRTSPSTPRTDEQSSQTVEQPNVFRLQLRPVEDPESFKPSVQLVSREFATRYLEQVGVRPSKATLDLVNRNVPLSEVHIKTTLRAKGHVEDELHITVPPVNHSYKVPVFINPTAVLQLGIGNKVLGATADEASGDGAGGVDGKRAAGSEAGGAGEAGGEGKPAGGSAFLDMAARYLHPFNLDLTLARQNLTALYAAARQRTAAAGDGDEAAAGRERRSQGRSSGSAGGLGGAADTMPSTSGRGGPGREYSANSSGGGAGGASGSGGGQGRRAGVAPVSWPRTSSGRLVTPQEHADAMASGLGATQPTGSRYSHQQQQQPTQQGPQDSVRAEVMDELLQPLLVTPEVVLTLQAQLESALADWHRHQAPEALKGRLTPAEFARTQEELSNEGSIKLLITLANFIHEELVRGHPDYPHHLDTRGTQSREGLHASASRRHTDIWEERGLLPRNSSTGDGVIGGGGANSRRTSSHAHQTSMNTQQMTNLQKYDLGYQAYVRQKLDQGPALQQGGALQSAATTAAGAGGGGGRGARSGAASPLAIAGGGGPGPRGAGSPPGLHDNARGVSFAAAPHYHSVPPSPTVGGGGQSAPDSPSSTHSRGGTLLGPLNLQGTLRPGASSPAHTHHSGAHGQHGRSDAPSAAGPHGPGLAASSLGTMPGLAPRVGRALKHSTSFALATAANTARSIHAALDAVDSGALQRERLFALHVEWAGRFKTLRQSRSGMFFTLPILLLSMRLCVNTLFATLYPTWTRMPEGAQLLEDMDAAICALFDPHGYLARALSVLQSTPSAIEAVTRHPQRRGKERRHFNDTSPLMQATLQGAMSSGARRLLASNANQPAGLSKLRTQLTPEQRAALFGRGLQWMTQPDPLLSQIGEPQLVGRLYQEGAI